MVPKYMKRLLAVLSLLAFCSCVDDRVSLRRGPLGPATYDVELGVSGGSGVRDEEVVADMRVENTEDGARLRLAVEGADPILAELRREPTGQLRLDSVQGVPPRSAGEADLASLVGQLDPPLPRKAVRLRDTWSSTRRIETETLRSVLRSRLRIVRFRRVGGTDAAELHGTVTGTLRTSGQAGVFEGEVSGRTTISWALSPGRVAESETTLVWTIRDVGRLVVHTIVRPA